MFMVLFEVHPKTEEIDTYLSLGKLLRPELAQIDGFIDNERFQSLSVAGRILSLSTWRDEKSLIRWRTHATHHGVQEQGRSLVLLDYRLRVAEVMHDSQPPEGLALQQQRFDETEQSPAKAVTVCEGEARFAEHATPDGCVERECFESLYTAGKFLELASWPASAAAMQYASEQAPRARAVRVIRQYGMHQRAEAPQYYPAAPAQGELVIW